MSGGDLKGSGNDAFDEDAFAKALFGSEDGEVDGSDGSENEVAAAMFTGVNSSVELATEAVKGKGRGAAGKKSRGLENQQRKKKRKQTGDVLVGYEQYAHLLDQYDEVNKQDLPPDEAQKTFAHRKRRKKSLKRQS